MCWTAHPERKPVWSDGSGAKQVSNGHLSRKVDKLAEQVAQLAQQVAAYVGKPVRSARQAEMRPLEEFGDEEPELNAGGAACNRCEGCDLSRDSVVDSGGEMDPREKFV
jgi:hypothetical protein